MVKIICIFLLIMVALCNKPDHYIFALWFLSSFLLSFFFSSPNLSGRRLDVYHTSAHGVAQRAYRPRRCGLSVNLECMFETCCTRLAANTGRKKSPFWYHRTTLSGYIFGTKACIDNRKKNLLNIDTSSTCSDNMVNFGLLTAEICWRVRGTPANFNSFHVLAALLHAVHGTLVVGVSQTAALNRGRHLYSAERPSRWALAHILVYIIFNGILTLASLQLGHGV